ncbi:MAG: hypothetical protein ACK4YF_03075 [Exilispira sp.]
MQDSGNIRKNTKWYDLKRTKDGYNIFYALSIRIQAIFLFLFSLLMLYFEIFENNEKVNIIAFIVFGLIFISSFIFSFLIDSFSIKLNKSQIIRKKGIFPFIFRQNIFFAEINSISVDVLEKTDKKYNFHKYENIPSGYYSGKAKEYTIIIEMKNGKNFKISFGKGDENLFNNFLEEIKKFM